MRIMKEKLSKKEKPKFKERWHTFWHTPLKQHIKRFFIWTWNGIKKLAIGAYNSVKRLGWFWGSFCVILAAIVFYSPAIVAVILYGVTRNWAFLAFAGSYVAWWFLPLGSPALVIYFAILVFIASLFSWTIKKKSKKPTT